MAEDSAEELRRPLADRRRQPRLPTRGTALVRFQRRELRADTVDISAHGVCLTLPHVCFCLRGNNGYRIGLNCALEDFVDDGAL
jgi:hypothetical protein